MNIEKTVLLSLFFVILSIFTNYTIASEPSTSEQDLIFNAFAGRNPSTLKLLLINNDLNLNATDKDGETAFIKMSRYTYCEEDTKEFLAMVINQKRIAKNYKILFNNPAYETIVAELYDEIIQKKDESDFVAQYAQFKSGQKNQLLKQRLTTHKKNLENIQSQLTQKEAELETEQKIHKVYRENTFYKLITLVTLNILTIVVFCIHHKNCLLAR